MKRMLVALTLAAMAAVPLASLAQDGPPMGPPPEMRAQMEKMRADAKAAAYAPLSSDHRSAVTVIVNQVVAGSLTYRAAVDQIDALLSPNEKTAVLAAEQTSRAAMRARMQAMRGDNGNGGPPPSGAPGGPAPGGPPPGAAGSSPGGPPPDGMRPDGREAHAPDAGRYLLTASLTREQMRAARPRPSATP